MPRVTQPRVRLELDRSHSSLDLTLEPALRQGAIPVGTDGRVDLRALVDHSALEVFANGRALTARIYPTRDDDALGAQVVLMDGVAVLDSTTTWAMRDIWTSPRDPLALRGRLAPTYRTRAAV